MEIAGIAQIALKSISDSVFDFLKFIYNIF